jgi:hypothetical protein
MEKKKVIRFALKMNDGVEVRTLSELHKHFDIDSIMECYLNGKLETWLEDRYYAAEVDQVQKLAQNDPDLSRKLCKIFDVEYVRDALSPEEIEARKRKLERLRNITDDDGILAKVDSVVFSQEELADLLDKGLDTVYLCGKDFQIPLSKKDMTYIGIQTSLMITKEQLSQYESNNIRLVNIQFPKCIEKTGFEAFKEILCDVSEILHSEEEPKEFPAGKRESVQKLFQELKRTERELVEELKTESDVKKSRSANNFIDLIERTFFNKPFTKKDIIKRYSPNCVGISTRQIQIIDTVISRICERYDLISQKTMFADYLRSATDASYRKLPFKIVMYHDFADIDIADSLIAEISQRIDYRKMDFIIAVFIFMEKLHQDWFRKHIAGVIKKDPAMIETIVDICGCILESDRLADETIINDRFTQMICDYVKGKRPSQTVAKRACGSKAIKVPSFLEMV